MRAQNDRAIVLPAPVRTYDISIRVKNEKKDRPWRGKGSSTQFTFLKMSVYDTFQSGVSDC